MPLIADISSKVSRLFADGCYRERDYEEPVVFHDKLYDAALFSFNLGRTIKRNIFKLHITVPAVDHAPSRSHCGLSLGTGHIESRPLRNH